MPIAVAPDATSPRPADPAPVAVGLTPARARTLLRREARLLLRGVVTGVMPSRAFHPGFAAQVRRTRGELAPLDRPRLLVESYRREALHSSPAAILPSPVRAAYAVRWVELSTGRRLPDWTELVVAVAATAELLPDPH